MFPLQIEEKETIFVHNLLMSGSRGSGKTLMARALPGILPDISIDEALD